MTGPKNWSTLFPKSCAGSNQSPIALEYANATFQSFSPGNFMPESVEIGEIELENDGLKCTLCETLCLEAKC